MGAIQSFFESMLEVVQGLIKLVTTFVKLITHPHKMVLVLVLWIVGIPIYTLTLLWYLIFSISILNYLQFLNYYFWTVIVLDLIVSLFYFALFCVYGAIAVAMWLLDLITVGLVRFLTRCENALDSWHTRANFAYGNTANRLLIAQLPCANRYKPNGFLCERQSNIEPSYCPHSQIYRIYTGMAIRSPAIIDKMDTKGTTFVSANPANRESMVRDFFRQRKGFLSACNGAMAPFQNIVRSICANPSTAPIKGESHRDLLKPLCLQAFCSGENNAPFCDALLKNQSEDTKKNAETKAGLGDVAKKMAILAVVIVLLTICLMLYAGNNSVLETK
jgi:hypothetical protein